MRTAAPILSFKRACQWPQSNSAGNSYGIFQTAGPAGAFKSPKSAKIDSWQHFPFKNSCLYNFIENMKKGC
jgi:hypothetical protein